jgi:ABC-2 type transport system permease protein
VAETTDELPAGSRHATEPITVPREAADTRQALGSVRAFLLIAGAWNRAAWQYRGSLGLMTAGQFLTSMLDCVAILVLFTRMTSFAGFTLPQVLFLYGTTRTSFAVSDLLASGVEELGDVIRNGEFDVALIRPVGTLPQAMAMRFTPKRFGKLGSALTTLVMALALLRIDWTIGRVAMIVVTLVCGTVIYCSIWVLSGAFTVVSTDAREITATFTYGSEFLTEYPLTTFGRPTAYVLLFGLPIGFVNWEPALYVLNRPDPFGLPYALRFAGPIAAGLLAVVSGLLWRAAVRRYRSTGS